jgi:MFS family permease
VIPARISPTTRTDQARRRRVAAATLVGTAIEWYDFNIYGAAAALIFASQFFPNFSPVAATLAAFGTFAVGFIARPIGGIVFGHFGDRYGRKHTLVASLLLMGIGTVLIAVLPTYAQIGLAAPILLVALRFVQGLGVGGEWGGAVLLALEHAPAGRRGFYSAFPQIGLPAGALLANLVFFAVSAALGPQQFAAWGWRIPFLLSAVLVVVALLVRLKVEESPEFSTLRSRGEVRRLPLVDVLRRSPAAVVLGMGITFAPSSLGYLLSVYLLSYGTGTAGVAPQTMLLAITAASVVYLVVACLTALVSDRVGPGRVFALASVLGVLVPFAVFALVNTAAVGPVLLATGLLGVVLGLMVAVQAVIVSAAFRADVRYTGSSLSYQLGAVLGGGLTPLFSATILGITGSWTAIAGYIALLAAVSGIAVWFLPRAAETADRKPATASAGARPLP